MRATVGADGFTNAIQAAVEISGCSPLPWLTLERSTMPDQKVTSKQASSPVYNLPVRVRQSSNDVMPLSVQTSHRLLKLMRRIRDVYLENVGLKTPPSFRPSTEPCLCGRNHYAVIADEVRQCPLTLYFKVIRAKIATKNDIIEYEKEKPLSRLIRRIDPERDAFDCLKCDYRRCR
jgi:hypothetical protein